MTPGAPTPSFFDSRSDIDADATEDAAAAEDAVAAEDTASADFLLIAEVSGGEEAGRCDGAKV